MEPTMQTDHLNSPVVFVLFGATGDLSSRLVVPALFNLFLNNHLPKRFKLLGIGRADLNDQSLRAQFLDAIPQHARSQASSRNKWEEFSAGIHYIRMDPSDFANYPQLTEQLESLDERWQSNAQRIYYMATPAFLFADIAENLGRAGLNREPDRARIVVEKPIGFDLNSFLDIDGALRKHFSEQQIFRIDHFLGKETVQNILVLRFANPIFEPLWNRRYIDHIAITVAETLGVEHRGAYYESAGALRDMVQNHLMQLFCLVAMEPPVSYTAEDIRGKKQEVLRAVRPIPENAVADFAARGQYDEGWIKGQRVPAYRAEPRVSPKSYTETFAALKLYVDNWRWQGVPFYLRTGKRMAADISEISIRFGDVPHNAFPAGIDVQPARLVIQIQPEQGIVLKFMAKEPGYNIRLHPVNMRFCYNEAFDRRSPAAYETLLWDIMRNDATLSMRADQVEAAWKIIEPVLSKWENNPPSDFPNYPAGSWGPEQAESLVARDGRNWLTPTTQTECGSQFE